jgi:hypothetical protein
MDSDRRGKVDWFLGRARTLGDKLREGIYLATGRAAYDFLAARGPRVRVPHGPWRLVLVASSRARRTYVPRQSNVRIQFFRAQTEIDEGPTPWDQLALGGVELWQVVMPNNNHGSMMRSPYVHVLATELAQALEETAHGEAQSNGAGNGVVHPPAGSNNGAAARLSRA